MDEMLIIIFGVLLILVLLWFALLKFIFTKLEQGHFEKYEQMGKQSLFLNNNMKTVFATLRFICKREHKALNDPLLSKISDFSLVVFLVHSIIFFSMFFGVQFLTNAT